MLSFRKKLLEIVHLFLMVQNSFEIFPKKIVFKVFQIEFETKLRKCDWKGLKINWFKYILK